MIHKVEKAIGGRTLSIETGRIARQAHGAVMVQYGETIVFCAVTLAKPREGLDFFPLTVDYREKTSSAGKIPGGFFKREGRPTTKEILTCRLMDRPIRPLFPKEFKMDTSVASMVVSADGQNDPDILAMIASSAALSISEAPFMGPTGSVRIGLIDDEFVVNPTVAELAESKLDLVVAGTRDAVTMVEAGAQELSEERILEAINKAHDVIKEIIALQDELVQRCGREKLEVEPGPDHSALTDQLRSSYGSRIPDALRTTGKHERKAAVTAVINEALDEVSPLPPEGEEPPADQPDRRLVKALMNGLAEDAEREMILSGSRTDGRSHTEIRDLTMEVGFLPRVHGSALFTRGETQSIVSMTLGTDRDSQIIDGLGEEVKESFLLPLQLPGILRRRDLAEPWTQAPRNRSRQPRAARAEGGPSRKGHVPVRGPRRVGHHRIERIVIDGDRLRRNARAHGRRCAAPSAGRGNRHGTCHRR